MTRFIVIKSDQQKEIIMIKNHTEGRAFSYVTQAKSTQFIDLFSVKFLRGISMEVLNKILLFICLETILILLVLIGTGLIVTVDWLN